MMFFFHVRDYNEGQLEQLFQPYGNIIQRNILKDKATGLSRGVGFVR
jgi:RNA recognition motif-containing protein